MKLSNLQALRAAAILGVILMHHRVPGARIGESGVDLFFIISGFVMVYITPKSLSSLRAYGRFMGHRIARIYPPYWAILFPFLLLWLLSPQIFYRTRDLPNQPTDLFSSIFLLPQNTMPLLLVSWTLIHEMYFYFVVGFALMLSTNKRWVFGGIWFLTVYTGSVLFRHMDYTDHRLMQVAFSPFSLTFLLGYFIGLMHQSSMRLTLWPSCALIAVGLLLLIIFRPPPWADGYPDNNHIGRFWCYGVPLSLVVAGVLALESICSLSNPWVQLMGDASYSLYLIHVPFMSLFHGFLKWSHLQNTLSPMVAGFVSICGCLMVGILFHVYAERPLNRFSKRKVDRFFASSSQDQPSGKKALESQA